MVKHDIVVPVTKPTFWISSMVVVQKKNGALFICMDPMHLNTNISINHCQPLKMLLHIYMGLKCPQSWMYIHSRVQHVVLESHIHSSLPSTPCLADKGGRECHLESALHLRCSTLSSTLTRVSSFTLTSSPCYYSLHPPSNFMHC